MIWISPYLALDERDIEETFIHAAGPGGQNVNKVASAVQLRFDLGRSALLTPEIKLRLARLAGRRLGQDGILTIVARTHRSQEQNRRDARERLADLVRRASVAPRARIPTRPSLAARERTRTQKIHHAAKKQHRRVPLDG